jgi:aryl-alcohol dehydrogenase-like predicted oxidoreductase
MAFGTMTFGTEWGWGANKDESRKMFDAYVEAGGNFFDTANRYTDGTSEKFLGEFVKSERGRYVVATKYTLSGLTDDPNLAGNHRKNMMQACEASLKRLGTDYVDLYWVHAWDFMTPVDEVMRGLDDLVRQGKVLYVGVSDTPAWVVSQANTMADLRGWSRFVGLQIRYSLIDRTVESELLPMARAFDMAVTPWSILGAGVLTGKYNADKAAEGRAKAGAATIERNLKIASEVVALARDIGCTPPQVAIAWVRQSAAVRGGVLVPLIGARNLEQLQDNLGALSVSLTPEQMERLDEVSRIDLGFPSNFLGQDNIREYVYGGTYDRIDNHRRDVSGDPL